MTDRSGGNPFYIEELISFIAEPADRPGRRRSRCATLELPGEPAQPRPVAHRRDGRSAAPDAQGRERRRAGVFEAPVLPGAYPELGSLDEVIDHLDTLRAADLVNLDRVAEQAYLFKHVATQEVAYESLPFALRTMLHGRVGRWLEAAEPDGDRAAARPARPPLLAERRRRIASGTYLSRGRRCGAAAPTRTTRPSGTWSV